MYLKFLKCPAVWYTDAVTRTINFVSIRRETVFINRVRISAPASSSPEERENEILSVRHGLWTIFWLPRIEEPTQKFTSKQKKTCWALSCLQWVLHNRFISWAVQGLLPPKSQRNAASDAWAVTAQPYVGHSLSIGSCMNAHSWRWKAPASIHTQPHPNAGLLFIVWVSLVPFYNLQYRSAYLCEIPRIQIFMSEREEKPHQHLFAEVRWRDRSVR